jgi:hypothetical protein
VTVIWSGSVDWGVPPQIIGTLIKEARKLGKQIIVDPKGKDFSMFRGDAHHSQLARARRRHSLYADKQI